MATAQITVKIPPKPLGALVSDVLYWPVWWYSRGLARLARRCWTELLAQQERLVLTVWVRNLFTPMFGQTDWQGRIISFFIRFFNIIGRSIVLLVWGLLLLAVVIVWICLPAVILYQVLFQLGLVSGVAKL